MSISRIATFSAIFGFFLAPVGAWACSVIGGVTSSVKLIQQADSVIRARAVEYAREPDDPNIRTTGVPDSKVRFEELELIRGEDASGLVLPGYVVQHDDFNDHLAPYHFVRPGGRAGSCFANSY